MATTQTSECGTKSPNIKKISLGLDNNDERNSPMKSLYVNLSAAVVVCIGAYMTITYWNAEALPPVLSGLAFILLGTRAWHCGK